MQGISLIAFCGLIVVTLYLTTTYDTSFAFDRPIHTAIIVLFFCGAGIIGAERIVKRRGSNHVFRREHYESIPLDDGPHHSSWSSSPVPQNRLGRWAFLAPHAYLALLLVVSICLRVMLLQRILKDVQCASQSYQAFLPFVLALNDIWFSKRRKNLYQDGYEVTIYGFLTRNIFHSRLRYLLPTIMLGWSSVSAASIGSLPRSTYICSQSLADASLVPRLQSIGLLLDAIILLILYHLLERGQDETPHDGGKMLLVGVACVLSSFILFVVGIILYFALPEHRAWIMAAPVSYLKDVLVLAVAVTCFVLICLYTIHALGIMTTAVIVVFTSTYVASFRASLITIGHPFPPIPDGKVVWCIVFLCIALLFYLIAEIASDSKLRSSAQPGSLKLPPRILSFFAFLLFLRIVFLFRHRSNAGFHPVDMLMYDAELEHRKWVKQAHSSQSLGDAIKTYQKRYHRHPPPRFDKWYEYAVDRSSAIIDDFDNINDDLAPFWSLSPSEIRERTWEILKNPRNGLGGISIRNGKGEISSNVPGTHRWMLDGVLQMIEKFGEWLPDMDIAMNLHDECRVAVPFHDMEAMLKPKQQATDAERQASDKMVTERSVVGDFSHGRASTWKPITEDITTDSGFIDLSFQRTFEDFGSISCPPNSPARTQRHWDTRSPCITCMRPHSMGPFVANWPLSTSPCHQPDLANLHGLHLSPANFTATHTLMPIFSQSKAPGYADIRYPSPWNYIPKTAYAPDPPAFPSPAFAEKENTLFWRGATTEGVSAGAGAWKGMLRQRLVHLLANATAPAPVLLPASSSSSSSSGRHQRLRYRLVPAPRLRALLPATIDVRFVAPVARCGGADCVAQAEEFGAAASVPFQQHWRYRYLLDVDGAGFSGRFLPFLASGGLVLKAGLVAEWWAGRVRPWVHFVPVGVRLLDLWALLGFFGGLEGEVDALGELRVPGRIEEARGIAGEGADWAARALRGEDMEVYFFRLLLEWGRLTDDRRDQIGM